jgi:hypothetical protein
MDSRKEKLDDLQAEIKQKFMQYMEASEKYSEEYEIVTTMRRTKDMTTKSPLFGTVYAEVTNLLPSGRRGGGSSPIWDKPQDPRVTICVDGKAAIEETVKTLTLLRDGISKALEWYQDKTINDNNPDYSETFTMNDGGAMKTVQVASSSGTFGKYIYPKELPTVDNNGRDKDLYSDKKLERKRKAQNQGECSETKRLGGDNENSTDANEGHKPYILRSNNCQSKKAKKDNPNTPFQNGQNNCGSEGCPGSTDTKTACCHCQNRIHRNERCGVKQVYMEDNGEQKEKYYCKTCYRNTSMEINGSKENGEKGITDKAGTVDGTKEKGQQCIRDEAALPETETDSISMTSDVAVITCNYQGCEGHTQLYYNCKLCNKRVGCNVQLEDKTRMCTKCFSENQEEYAGQAIKNHKN